MQELSMIEFSVFQKFWPSLPTLRWRNRYR